MELGGNVIGSIAGSLHLEGEGDSIEINPIVTSGTKIATITINEGKPDEANFDLYAPEYTPFSGVYNDLTGKPYLNGQVISENMFTNIYLTNELRVGTWLDGSPVYRNYINLQNAARISPGGTLIDIGIVDIKQPVSAMGVYDIAEGEEQTMPLLWFKYNNGHYFSSSTTGGVNKLILEYTKS